MTFFAKSIPVFLFLVLMGSTHADVTLPDVISDNMMLQADHPVRVWGWADPGENVTVAVNGHSLAVQAGEDGSWSVLLDPMPPSPAPSELVIHGADSNRAERVRNVIVGDVWMAGGQSNMAYPVKNCLNSEREISTADYPEIRIFIARRNIHADSPRFTEWRTGTGERGQRTRCTSSPPFTGYT